MRHLTKKKRSDILCTMWSSRICGKSERCEAKRRRVSCWVRLQNSQNERPSGGVVEPDFRSFVKFRKKRKTSSLIGLNLGIGARSSDSDGHPGRSHDKIVVGVKTKGESCEEEGNYLKIYFL